MVQWTMGETAKWRLRCSWLPLQVRGPSTKKCCFRLSRTFHIVECVEECQKGEESNLN